MREDKRIIFPSDRDIIEERTKDELRDRIHSKCSDTSDGEKSIIIDFDSTYLVKCRMRNGMLFGLVRCYDAEGNKIAIIQYINDVRHGLYTKYDITGWVCCSGMYKDGNCYGTWRHYDEDGNVIRSTSYE